MLTEWCHILQIEKTEANEAAVKATGKNSGERQRRRRHRVKEEQQKYPEAGKGSPEPSEEASHDNDEDACDTLGYSDLNNRFAMLSF